MYVHVLQIQWKFYNDDDDEDTGYKDIRSTHACPESISSERRAKGCYFSEKIKLKMLLSMCSKKGCTTWQKKKIAGHCTEEMRQC